MKSACLDLSRSTVSQEPSKKKLRKILISESLERAKVNFANFEETQLAEKTPNELYMNF